MTCLSTFYVTLRRSTAHKHNWDINRHIAWQDIGINKSNPARIALVNFAVVAISICKR